MINVLIADDHNIVIDGLTEVLNAETGISVVAQASSGEEVLRILEKQQIDVAIIDIEMPNINGIELSGKLKVTHPEIGILILSMHKSVQYIKKLIELGVDGYLLKNTDKKELVHAIREIAKGEIYLNDEVSKLYIKSKRLPQQSEVRLTKREQEVLSLIAEDNTTNDISEKLHIEKSTVETHRRNLIKKTRVNSSLGLVRYAIENGFVNKQS